jgi:hypothetical protein
MPGSEIGACDKRKEEERVGKWENRRQNAVFYGWMTRVHVYRNADQSLSRFARNMPIYILQIAVIIK